MKQIQGFEDYYVTEFGECFSFKFSKFKKLKPATDKLGYNKVVLHVECKAFSKKLHRLIAKTFILNPLNKPHVNHINGIKNDNRVVNLEWCTRSENIKHADKLGLRNIKGENNTQSKLNQEQVMSIILDSRKQKLIAIEYNVSPSLISQIKKRKAWIHV